MSKNVIFHIDVNSAFLSWEAVFRLAHKGDRQKWYCMGEAVSVAFGIGTNSQGMDAGEVREYRRR